MAMGGVVLLTIITVFNFLGGVPLSDPGQGYMQATRSEVESYSDNSQLKSSDGSMGGNEDFAVDPSATKTGSQCQGGTYFNTTSRKCLPCQLNYFCFGGMQGPVRCPAELVTKSVGAASIVDCSVEVAQVDTEVEVELSREQQTDTMEKQNTMEKQSLMEEQKQNGNMEKQNTMEKQNGNMDKQNGNMDKQNGNMDKQYENAMMEKQNDIMEKQNTMDKQNGNMDKQNENGMMEKQSETTVNVQNEAIPAQSDSLSTEVEGDQEEAAIQSTKTDNSMTRNDDSISDFQSSANGDTQAELQGHNADSAPTGEIYDKNENSDYKVISDNDTSDSAEADTSDSVEAEKAKKPTDIGTDAADPDPVVEERPVSKYDPDPYCIKLGKPHMIRQDCPSAYYDLTCEFSDPPKQNICYERCACPPELPILHDGRCITKSKCPNACPNEEMQYNRGNYIFPHPTCNDPRIRPTNKAVAMCLCPKDKPYLHHGKCFKIDECPPDPAVATEGASHSCIVQGNSHIKTFDGKRYQFNGPCTYALVLDNQKLAFAVYVEVVKCSMYHEGTCVQSLSVFYEGASFQLYRGWILSIGGEKMTVFSKDKYIVGNMEVSMDGYSIITTMPDNEIVIKFDGVLGIEVLVTGGSYVTPGKLGGLCGNFNGRPSDDFTENSWPLKITEQLEDFVSSWKINGKSCRYPRKTRKMCNNLRDGPRKVSICDTIFENIDAGGCTVPKEYYKEGCSEDSCTLSDLFIDIQHDGLALPCIWLKYYEEACQAAGTPVLVDYKQLGSLYRDEEQLQCPEQCKWFQEIYLTSCPIALRETPECL